jgi:hypothetical protein
MLEIDRLVIWPLTGERLDELLNEREDFENNTGYIYEGEPLEGILYDIFSKQVNIVKESKQEYY